MNESEVTLVHFTYSPREREQLVPRYFFPRRSFSFSRGSRARRAGANRNSPERIVRFGTRILDCRGVYDTVTPLFLLVVLFSVCIYMCARVNHRFLSGLTRR